MRKDLTKRKFIRDFLQDISTTLELYFLNIAELIVLAFRMSEKKQDKIYEELFVRISHLNCGEEFIVEADKEDKGEEDHSKEISNKDVIPENQEM